MRSQATALGEDIIHAEADLDTLFRQGSPDPGVVAALAERLGTLNGKLRAVHLTAHLQTKRLLTAVQVAAYNQARGYGKTNQLPEPGGDVEKSGASQHHH